MQLLNIIIFIIYGSLISCLIGAYFIVVQQYKKTAYYKITGNSYLSMKFDKGKYGEYLTYRALRVYEADGAKFLFNCYLPRDNGETTEIDILMIHKSGIYVFESKNYSGWIFGNEKGKTWTQTLPQGRRSHKEHFLNPIIQNKLHIKWLKNFIADDTIPLHSIIVFSERCSLKSIAVFSSDVAVIKRGDIVNTVSKVAAGAVYMLDNNKVLRLYTKLYPCTQVSGAFKQKHIDDINTRIQLKEQKTAEKVEQLNCPRCGAPLVLRVAKKGQNAGRRFYGCSTYPKCRYIHEPGGS